MLLKGQIDIIKDGVKMVTLNKVGTAFGEIALTSSIAVRIATVICSQPSVFLTLSREHYK